MRTLLNIIWFLFSGLWLALGYILAGVIACLLIITIPIGVASFRMAVYVAWPFGKAVVENPHQNTALSGVANFVWFITCGWWLAIAHIVFAFTQALTLLGILNAVVSLKMLPVTCVPFGKRIVDASELRADQRPLHAL